MIFICFKNRFKLDIIRSVFIYFDEAKFLVQFDIFVFGSIIYIQDYYAEL